MSHGQSVRVRQRSQRAASPFSSADELLETLVEALQATTPKHMIGVILVNQIGKERLVAKWFAVIGLSCLLLQPASAQMHIQAQPERVRIGITEWLPRCQQGPSSLIIPAGQSVTPPADSTWDCVEVAGTLKISRTYDTTMRFVTRLVLPGGVIDVGTEADPVHRKVEFIVRDAPIDTRRDPFQWTHGDVNLGRLQVHGLPRTAWTNTTDDVAAGATEITVDEADGWLVGDELLLPDMREPMPNAVLRRESRVSIAAISGRTITLSKPLDFEHASIRMPDGEVVKTPYVANLTRNIVWRSENPTGVRGHTANVGHQASWDVRYAAFIDLGRTKTEPHDNTVVGPDGTVQRIGTQQVGRYTTHNHHASGGGSRYTGNVYIDGMKWAAVTHGTSDSVVTWNVGVGFKGGCFVTEDGNEFRNLFDQNFCAYSQGIGSRSNASDLVVKGCPGCEGAGFWLRGVQNIVTNNVSINNHIGINLFNQPVPATKADSTKTKPILMRGNATIANRTNGLEYWSQGFFLVEDHLSAHNDANVFGVISGNPNNFLGLKNPTFVGQFGRTIGIHSSAVYIAGLTVEGGQIVGHAIGIADGGGSEFLVRNVTMQNVVNIDLTFMGSVSATMENVRHRPLGTNPLRYIEFGKKTGWTPGDPLPGGPDPAGYFYARGPFTGSRYRIISHQGVAGEDFSLYTYQQHRSAPMWPTLVPPDVCGTTQGEAWDRCGVAYLGDVIGDDEIVPVEGLSQGLARRGVTRTLGAPRLTLSQPNATLPVALTFEAQGQTWTRGFLLLGGDTSAGRGARVTVDGQRPVEASASAGEPHVIAFWAPASSGTHTIKAVRLTANGRVIPSTERTFTYCVPGPCNGTPPPSSTSAQAR